MPPRTGCQKNTGVTPSTPDSGDTLIEARDADFSLSTTTLEMVRSELSDVDPTVTVTITETETVTVFESFVLYGGAGDNNFALVDFTSAVRFDGTEGSDSYTLTLSGPLSGQSAVYVEDSGETGSDAVIIQGGSGNDTMHLDADTSRQEIKHELPTSGFTLSYHGETTTTISASASAADIRAALVALDGIIDVEVTAGSASNVWNVRMISATKNLEDKFYRLTSATLVNDLPVATTRVVRSTVTRIDPNTVASLLSGKPDVDSMFSRPANEQQFFNRIDGHSRPFKR